MKPIRRFLALLAMAALCALAIPMSASAAISTYDGAWTPTDETVFMMDLTKFEGEGSLYLYDYENTGNSLEILEDGMFDMSVLYFHEDAGNWYVGTSAGGTDLNLGTTPLFGLYFSDGADIYTSYLLAEADGLSYVFDTNTGMMALMHDMQAVPVPIATPALLLGTGLIGMITMRRKSAKN